MNIQPGSSIGRYHIQEQLGLGGMATVYKAYDTRLERDVAVKVIRTGAFPPDVLDRILKRFDREAKSLARLNHPNIVGIIDYGEQDGTPYLVMPFYPAGTLKQSLGKPAPPAEAARLLVPVARALAYAHQQGILHRDVKPSNILITGSGEPVLTDFGIAKLLEDDSGATLTGTGVGVGTPEYMAPEQGMGREIDGRADVYALGVVLYELVTGRKPYTADTPMAVIFKHLTDPLPRPKEAVANLPDVVEQIILKALAKKPENRYQSMGDFAAALAKIDVQPRESAAAVAESQSPSARQAPDLYDVYEDETGEATMDMGETPPSLGNIPGTAASSMPQSPLGSVHIPPQRVSQNYSEPDGDETGELTSDLGAGLPHAGQIGQKHIASTMESLLDSAGKSSPALSTPKETRTTFKSNIPLAKMITHKELATPIWDKTLSQIVYSSSGNLLAAAFSDGIVLFDASTHSNIGRIGVGKGRINSIAISPDGKLLAAGLVQKTIVLYETMTGSEILTLEGHSDDIWSVAFSPDGRILASASWDRTIILWDVLEKKHLRTLKGHLDWVFSVVFSPLGDKLASGSYDNTVKIWDLASGNVLQKLQGHTRRVRCVAFSPDGTNLASGSADNSIILWRVQSGAQLLTLKGHTDSIRSIAFSPDGRIMASGSWDQTIKLWNSQNGELLQTLEGHNSKVISVAFSPDGSQLASGSTDGTIRIWDMANR